MPSTFSPCSSLLPCLRGSSSTNPTGRRRSPGLRISSRTTSRPPSAAADDQHVARALGGAEARHPAFDHQVHEKPRADQQRQRQQQEQRDHAGRQRDGAGLTVERGLDRMHERDAADDQQRGQDHALDHRLVVALPDVRPQPLVEPERRPAPPAKPTTTQGIVVSNRCSYLLGNRVIEPQPKGEEVSERDQDAVHQQLGSEWRWIGKAADLIRRRMQAKF